MDNDLTRRDLIKLGAAATLAASLGVSEPLAAQTSAPAFFTPEEFALVDELSEMIIPTDSQSPGARAAKVAAYIDARLSEAWEETTKAKWRNGLTLVQRRCQEANGRPFLQSTPGERLALLTQMAQNERTPKTPEELFFAELKSRVVDAYYTSETGIRQDMEYKGNGYLAEFVGSDVS